MVTEFNIDSDEFGVFVYHCKGLPIYPNTGDEIWFHDFKNIMKHSRFYCPDGDETSKEYFPDQIKVTQIVYGYQDEEFVRIIYAKSI